MSHIFFAVVGPASSGKTTLINRALEALPDSLRVVKTYTTRDKRSEEADRQHMFVTRDEVERMVKTHDIVEIDEYAGNYYCTPKSYLDGILREYHGIKAITEPGAIGIRNKGYDVRVIKIIPKNYEGTKDEKRIADDLNRSKIPLAAEKEIVNDFGPGGIEQASAEFIEYITSLG